jgi:LL-diaminopimelate aminotransferase
MPSIHPVLRSLPDYPIVRVEAAKARVRESGREVFDFGTGDPIEPTPGFIRDALRDGLPDVCRYPSPRGSTELLEAAAAYMKRRFDLELEPGRELIAVRGSKEAIFHLPFAFLDVPAGRDTVVYPSPGYTVYASGTRFAGGVAHGVPMVPENAFLLRPSELPAEVLARTAMLWINYPHNPSGTLAPDGYLKELAEFAAEGEAIVCSDECYVDVYSSARPRSLLEFGRKNVLAFFSCSKRSGMTGYRTGFVAGDADLVAAYTRLRPNIGVATPVFVEAAAAAAWSDDAHASERNELFSAKRRVLSEFLAEAGLEVVGGDATFFLWFKVPGGDEVAYCERLLEQGGLVLIPGSYFGAGGEGFARVALVPSLEDCKRAVEVWRGLL